MRRLEESDEDLIPLDSSLFDVYISPSQESKDFLEENSIEDQINISYWSASFSPIEQSIFFSLNFTNFAYISKDSESD